MKFIRQTDLAELKEKRIKERKLAEVIESAITAIERYERLDLDTVTLDEYKEMKIAMLNELCNRYILNGFVSNSTGYEFIFDQEAQDNFNQASVLLLLNPDMPGIEWKTEDAGNVAFSREQFIPIVLESANHKIGTIAKYRELKQRVLDAKTKEEVKAIHWE